MFSHHGELCHTTEEAQILEHSEVGRACMQMNVSVYLVAYSKWLKVSLGMPVVSDEGLYCMVSY